MELIELLKNVKKKIFMLTFNYKDKKQEEIFVH